MSTPTPLIRLRLCVISQTYADFFLVSNVRRDKHPELAR